MEPQTMEQMPRKKGVYNKERYEQNKEEILKYRHERHRTVHKEDLNIKVSTGRNVFNDMNSRTYLMRREYNVTI